MKARFRKDRFKVKTRAGEGFEYRDGYSLGQWAVHREPGNSWWTLTHKPSGYAVNAWLPNKAEAQGIVEFLNVAVPHHAEGVEFGEFPDLRSQENREIRDATAIYQYGSTSRSEYPKTPDEFAARDEARRRYLGRSGLRPNRSARFNILDAEHLYETFHQFEPQRVGEFHAEFSIPKRARHVGEAKVMYYSSDKLNPETGEDEGIIHYFHEHEGGVGIHLFDDDHDGKMVMVPARVRAVDALVRLGKCEGFEYEDFDGKTVEAEGTGRLPEWYATPDGKALLVIQGKRRVIAILWGGSLDVRAEGVVG